MSHWKTKLIAVCNYPANQNIRILGWVGIGLVLHRLAVCPCPLLPISWYINKVLTLLSLIGNNKQNLRLFVSVILRGSLELIKPVIRIWSNGFLMVSNGFLNFHIFQDL